MRLLLVLLLVACSAGPPGPGLDTDRVLAHVAHLATAPRVHDTDGSRAALAYLEHEVGGGERLTVGDVDLPAIAHLHEKVRPPYNLSALDQRAARFMLREGGEWCAARASEVVTERARLAAGLAAHGEVFPSEANLLLVRFRDARAVWQKLVDAGVLVRLFDAGPLAGCLRITVGTPAENDLVLGTLSPLSPVASK